VKLHISSSPDSSFISLNNSISFLFIFAISIIHLCNYGNLANSKRYFLFRILPSVLEHRPLPLLPILCYPKPASTYFFLNIIYPAPLRPTSTSRCFSGSQSSSSSCTVSSEKIRNHHNNSNLQCRFSK